MNRSATKTTALFTVIVMLLSLFSVTALPVSAQAPAPDDFDPGVTLDYDTMRDKAYIVNSEWTELSGKLSYSFRSKTYTETYSALRHFNDFNTAYAAYLSSGSTDTPVFILNGTFAGEMKISSSVVILGANAGISPNAPLDLETADPTAGWQAAERNTETGIAGTFLLTNSQAAEYELVFDGLLFNGTDAAYKKTDTIGSPQNSVSITVQHVTVNQNASSAYLFDDRNSVSVHTYEFNDLRVEGSSFQAMLDNKAVGTQINGLCFTDNVGSIISGTVEAAEFDFDIRNSYIYNNHVGYTILVRYTEDDHHVSNIDVHNNIFYNSNTGNYGFMVFCSTANSSKSSYSVNVRNNTIISTTGRSYTLFNGSYSYQKGSYTLNCNYNRVIGYVSMFPNVSGSTIGWEGYNMIKADFNYNYFNDTYTSRDDVIDEETWVRSDYGVDHPYIDPFDSEKIIYYKDYKLTVYDGMLDITGADFYDDTDYLSIDNENNEVSFGLAKGVTVTGITKDYGFNFATQPDSVLYYYTEDVEGTDVKVPITSFGAPADDTFEMYYADVTYGNVTETYMITVYGETSSSVQSFDENFTDPAGEISKTAYLYVPGLSGTTYTISLNGYRYSFTVNSNAFDSLSKIFEQAENDGVEVPQIILTHGDYGTLSITDSCEIYGYNYLTPATGGTGADTRYPGSSWTTALRTNVSAVTVMGGETVKISGITLNGNFTDTARTGAADITVKNSIVNGSFDFSSSGVKNNAENSFTLSGVLVERGTGALIKNSMPANIIVSNIYAKSGVTQLFDSGWSDTVASVGSSLSLSDSRFDGVGDSFIITPVSAAYENAKITVDNTAFYAGGDIELLFDIDHTLITAEFTQNAFINAVGADCTLFDAQPSVFTRNRIISFTPGFTADYNYLADYTPGFKTATAGLKYGELYYVDYALTTLNTEYGIDYIKLGNGGAVRSQFSNNFNTVRITLGSGSADGVVIMMQGGVEALVYSDPACTVAADLSSAVYGKTYNFYAKAPSADVADSYRVIIDSVDKQNDFTDGFEDDTLLPSALMVEPSLADSANGDSVYVTWQGKSWHFVKGINAFDSLSDAFKLADEKATRVPQILVRSISGDLNITRAANIFSQNHNTVPYLKTDSFDGSDWTYNTKYDTYKTTVGNIVIGSAATGSVGVYGFEMTGGYVDNLRPKGSKCNVHLENILINSTTTANVLFNQNGNSVRVDASYPNNDNTDKFTVKNTYIRSCSSTRFMYEWHTQTVEFDGLFMDCDTYPVKATNYVKQAGLETKLIFRNCNFRNLDPTNNLFQFEGNRVTVSKGQTREVIMENNIFYNFLFSKSGFFAFYPSNFTAFTMTGNRLINTTGNKALLYSFYNSTSYTPLVITLKDNVLAGFSTTVSLGTNNVDADASVISGNYAVPVYTSAAVGQSFSVTAGNATLTSTNHALDDPLKPLDTDFALQSVTGPGTVTLEDTAIEAQLVNASLSELVFTYDSADILPVFYTDANCTALADTSAAAVGTYYVRGEFTAADGVTFTSDTVYTLTSSVVQSQYPLFHKEFTDTLIPKTALLVDQNSAAASVLYETSWDGTTYAFVKNVNVFETLAAAVEYADSNGIADPHFMLKDIDGYSGDNGILDFFVPAPGSYYTQNYNKVPFNRGTLADGSDWSSNIGTGSGNFDTSKGITVYWLGFNQMTSGSYKLYGFTIRSVIQDNTRSATSTVDVLIQNTYYRKTHNGYPALLLRGNQFTTKNGEYKDKVVFKDMYFVEQSSNSFFQSGYGMWATTVFDGLYADFAGTSHSTSSVNVLSNNANSSLEFRNCNLRNFVTDSEHISFNSLDAATSTRGDKKLVLENNIFYNYHFCNADTFLYAKLCYYSELTIKNNRIYSPSNGTELLATPKNSGDGLHEYCKLTVTDNFLNGIDSTVYVDNRTLDIGSVIQHNYLNTDYSSAPTATGTPLSGITFDGTAVNGGAYYLDADMTILSDKIDAMTFNGESFESTATLTVESQTQTADILSLIDPGFNNISFYSDSELSLEINPQKIQLGSLGATVYMLVRSHDNTATETRTVYILREEGYSVSNTGLGSEFDNTKNGITFNWVGWRGEVKATGVTVSGEADHRVGVIYLSNKQNLDSVKSDLQNGLTSVSSLETVAAQINESYAAYNNIKVYCFHKDHVLTWDNATQSYGYRYNFSVQEEYYRGAVMYVVYEDANGNVQIEFSDLVVQQS